MVKFRVGESVRVIAETRGWGRVKADNIGVVRSIHGGELCVDFPAQEHWNGSFSCFRKTRKKFAAPKLADKTGFEVDEYKSSNRIAGLGRKTKEVLKIERKALKKILGLVPDQGAGAKTLMLGGKRRLIKEVIPLPHDRGCQDTGGVSSANVANAVNTFVACGMTPLGFGIARWKTGRGYGDVTDSLLNNMKTWQVLFPGCFVLVATKKRNMVFQLGKEIKQLNLETIKSQRKRR